MLLVFPFWPHGFHGVTKPSYLVYNIGWQLMIGQRYYVCTSKGRHMASQTTSKSTEFFNLQQINWRTHMALVGWYKLVTSMGTRIWAQTWTRSQTRPREHTRTRTCVREPHLLTTIEMFTFLKATASAVIYFFLHINNIVIYVKRTCSWLDKNERFWSRFSFRLDIADGSVGN